MSPVNILSVTPAGRLKKETDVVDYVHDMLKAVNLRAAFVLRITEKIHGGPEHHGIEISPALVHSAVRLKVQYGDNGTRYLCYLQSREMKPRDVLLGISAHVTDYRWKRDEVKPQTKILADSITSSLAPVQSVSTPGLTSDEPAVNTHLIVYATDPTLRNFMVTAIEHKFGTGEFCSKEFHTLMLSLIGKTPTTVHAVGQLARRLAELGILCKSRTAGVKRFYRLAVKNTDTVSPLPAKQQDSKLSELRRLVAEYDQARDMLAEFDLQEGPCKTEIDKLRQQLADAEHRLCDLKDRRVAYEDVVNDPVHIAAQAKLAQIDEILGR